MEEKIQPSDVTLVRVLKDISEHPFVTLESSDRRAKAAALLEIVHQKINENGHSFTTLMFLEGSVALGVANSESDIDALILTTAPQEVIEQANNAINFQQDVQHVRMVNIDTIINQALDPRLLGELLSSQDVEPGYDILLREFGEAAILFAPSLAELKDQNEHQTVNAVRKKFIDLISERYPGKENEIWQLVAKYIEKYFVRYENITMGDGSKREKKLVRAIKTVIRDRFDTQEKRARAYAAIQKMRNNFKFPTFAKVQEELS